MAHYLIEIRFHGKAKIAVKYLGRELRHYFHIRTEKHPHITLAGPFYTNDEERLINDFEKICSRSQLMDFEIEGFGLFENTKVVFLDVNPSKELEEFRWKFTQTLKPYCNLTKYDLEKEWKPHATIAMKIPYHKFQEVANHIGEKQEPIFKHIMVRATLLKGGFILREYDFLLRRSLIRKLAKSRRIYAQTLSLLKKHIEERNIVSFGDNQIIPCLPNAKPKKRTLSKSRVFVTSDLHLNHGNIIKYCARPFLNVNDMNKTLIKNWNSVVGEKDKVYFLGDLAFHTYDEDTKYWLSKLNGRITRLWGNHDKDEILPRHLILNYKGKKFYLCHFPEEVPKSWKGWAICGHNHNNDIEKYPFIDKINKRINVSIELTNYRPVNMDDIVRIIDGF